jgi:hypothetical protein
VAREYNQSIEIEEEAEQLPKAANAEEDSALTSEEVMDVDSSPSPPTRQLKSLMRRQFPLWYRRVRFRSRFISKGLISGLNIFLSCHKSAIVML